MTRPDSNRCSIPAQDVDRLIAALLPFAEMAHGLTYAHRRRGYLSVRLDPQQLDDAREALAQVAWWLRKAEKGYDPPEKCCDFWPECSHILGALA